MSGFCASGRHSLPDCLKKYSDSTARKLPDRDVRPMRFRKTQSSGLFEKILRYYCSKAAGQGCPAYALPEDTVFRIV
jgi:hypothetical protein